MTAPTLLRVSEARARGAVKVPTLRLAGFALWLGLVGFGGSYAVTQRIRQTVVDEKRWFDGDVFQEQFGVAGALPGTMATNLFTMLGLSSGGLLSAALCATAFLTPSLAAMLLFGVFYDRIRHLEAMGTFLDGMSFATVGVVAAVAVDLGRVAARARLDLAIAAASAFALSLGAMSLLEVVACAGLVGMAARRMGQAPVAQAVVESAPGSRRLRVVLPWPLLALGVPLGLLGVFAHIGVATFGGGYAMIPSIEHEVVAVRGWLTEPAFRDAMVFGQITPGPVAVAATFIGYRVGRWSGSLAATLGMFGPPFFLSVLAARSISAFRSNVLVQGFLTGVSPAVVGVIAAAGVSLWRTSVHSCTAAAIAVASFAVLVRLPKLSALLPLLAGGLLTWGLHLFG
jgi:chromate transporter